MEKCQMMVSEPLPYRRFALRGRLTPSLPISIYQIGTSKPLVFPAILDTGSEFPLVISPEIRDELMMGGGPDGQDSIWVGQVILCDIFEVKVKLAGAWKASKAYAPCEGDFDNIVGLPLLKDINCCLRFPEGQLHLAEA